MKVIVKAPAKINLFLKINGRRHDGFHDLTTVMQSVSLFDTMDITIYDKDNHKYDKQIVLNCNLSYIPLDERNLIYKITDYIFNKYNITDYIYIYLKKIIPTSAGMGGGSSDAANLLLFFNKHYKLNLTISELSEIAVQFGADIPYFLRKKISLCEGIGDKITTLKAFNNYFVLIVTPNIRVSTKEIFEEYDYMDKNVWDSMVDSGRVTKILDSINERNLNGISLNAFNDLERITILRYPELKIIKDKLENLGAKYALMSGSGPTVFGIYNSFFKMIHAKSVLKKENPNYFVYAARPI